MEPRLHRVGSVLHTELDAARARLSFAGILHKRLGSISLIGPWAQSAIIEQLLCHVKARSVRWNAYSKEHYDQDSTSVEEDSDMLTAVAAPSYRAALAAGLPAVGSAASTGVIHYVEFELLSMGRFGMLMGVARTDLNVLQSYAQKTPYFWGLGRGTGVLCHAGHNTVWESMAGCTKGDIFGLRLDCGVGRLDAYKNGKRLGVVVDGLAGELSWAVAMMEQGDSVRITAKVPPKDGTR